jgi:hypothetical protein
MNQILRLEIKLEKIQIEFKDFKSNLKIWNQIEEFKFSPNQPFVV